MTLRYVTCLWRIVGYEDYPGKRVRQTVRVYERVLLMVNTPGKRRSTLIAKKYICFADKVRCLAIRFSRCDDGRGYFVLVGFCGQ